MELVQQVTPSPFASESPRTATPTNTAPVPATPTVQAAPTEAVPEGWIAYIQPASAKSGSFSFAYPDGWLFQPFDVTAPGIGLSAVLWSWTEGKPPPGAMKVDVSILPVAGFDTDPEGSCNPGGSTTTSFAGQATWQKESVPHPSLFPRLKV